MFLYSHPSYGVEITEENNGTYTGVAFDTKDTVTDAEIRFDRFNYGVAGENLTDETNSSCTGCWGDYSAVGVNSEDPKFNASVTRDGSMTIKTLAGVGDYSYGDSIFTRQTDRSFTNYFVSIKVKVDFGNITTPEDDGNYQWKIIRVGTHDNATLFQTPSHYLLTWRRSDTLWDFLVAITPEQGGTLLAPTELKKIDNAPTLLQGKWCTLQMWSIGHATTGIFGWTITSDDGVYNERKDWTGNTLTSGSFNDFRFGYTWANMETGAGTFTNYWDDAYMDNSLARVVVGNASDYNACTVYEMQSIVSWSNTVIVTTPNAGILTSGWAYVFDKYGNRSAGHPVAFAPSTAPVVTLQVDKQATNPTTYPFEFSVEPGRTGATIVSSGGGTVTCTDGNCFDDETETGIVSNVPVPSTDTLTVTDSSAETGNDSINLALPSTEEQTIKGAIIKGTIIK